MKRTDAERLITKIVESYQLFTNASRTLKSSLGVSNIYESDLGKAFCNSMDAAVEAISIAIGDKDKTIDWFMAECDCGRKPMKCYVHLKEYEPRTVSDLMEVLLAMGCEFDEDGTL